MYNYMNRIFRMSKATPEEAIIVFDSQWENFASRMPPVEELATLGNDQLCSIFNIDLNIFNLTILASLKAWKQSPSQSLIHVLDNINNEVPKGKIFPDLFTQGRILFSSVNAKLLPQDSLLGIYSKDKKPLMIAHDAQAVTTNEFGITKINEIARILKIWELRNYAKIETGIIKIPSIIYRGIRTNNIKINSDKSENNASKIGNKEPYEIIHSRYLDRITSELISTPLSNAMKSPILSFTASNSVASKFTNDEGFLLSVNPKKMRVIATWETDELLSKKDEILKVYERELIVRIPPDLILSSEEIKIQDHLYAITTLDPSGITMLQHNDHASYTLEGKMSLHIFNTKPAA